MIGNIRNVSLKGNFNIQNLKNAISFGATLPDYLNDALSGIKQDEFQRTVPYDNDYEFELNEKLKKETPNDFIKWAQETDFINNGLKEALKPENRIGEGFHHGVYNIPGNNDYVLRIGRDYYSTTQDVDYSNYEIKDTRDMQLDCNIGQEVANLKDPSSDTNVILNYPSIEVLKRQNGYANANPSPDALYVSENTDELRKDILPYEHESRKIHYAKSMEALANMPDETYDELIDDIINAGEAGYKFDMYNSNNFLIDEENQRINLIDMPKVAKPHKDRFGDTLYALINLEFFSEYTRSSADYHPENHGKPREINDTIINILTILDKYTNAMERKLQKYNQNSFYFRKILLSMIGDFWLGRGDLYQKYDKLREMNVLYEPKN